METMYFVIHIWNHSFIFIEHKHFCKLTWSNFLCEFLWFIVAREESFIISAHLINPIISLSYPVVLYLHISHSAVKWLWRHKALPRESHFSTVSTRFYFFGVNNFRLSVTNWIVMATSAFGMATNVVGMATSVVGMVTVSVAIVTYTFVEIFTNLTE